MYEYSLIFCVVEAVRQARQVQKELRMVAVMGENELSCLCQADLGERFAVESMKYMYIPVYTQ